MNQDQEHLKLLSIFHYIVAVIAAMVSCIPLIHFFMGMGMLTGFGNFGGGPEAFVGLLMMVFAGLFILGGWAFAICMGLAGKYLGEGSHYQFCFVMACIACVFPPFGTVLGILTLVVLMRPTVKPLFGLPAPVPAGVPVPYSPPPAGPPSASVG
ncbi:MAG TPA: hypothetical protein VHN15_07395 [Thermoanaerobaculia bacterium]|nr:hypothetical protein [Thermoanaerobaculia bacterium]